MLVCRSPSQQYSQLAGRTHFSRAVCSFEVKEMKVATSLDMATQSSRLFPGMAELFIQQSKPE